MTGHDPYRAQTPTAAVEDVPPAPAPEPRESRHFDVVLTQEIASRFGEVVDSRLPLPGGVALDGGETLQVGDDVSFTRDGVAAFDAVVLEVADDVVMFGPPPDAVVDDETPTTHRVAVEQHVYDDAIDPDGHEWSTLTISPDHFAGDPADATHGRPSITVVLPGDIVELVVVDHEDVVPYPMRVVGISEGDDERPEGGVVLADLGTFPGAVHVVEIPDEMRDMLDPEAGRWALPRHLLPADVDDGDGVVFVRPGETPTPEQIDDAAGVVVEIGEGHVVVDWSGAPTPDATPGDGETGTATDGETAPQIAPDGSPAPEPTDADAGPETPPQTPETGRYNVDAVPLGAAEAVAWIDDGDDRADQIARADAARRAETARPENQRRSTVLAAIAAVLD